MPTQLEAPELIVETNQELISYSLDGASMRYSPGWLTLTIKGRKDLVERLGAAMAEELAAIRSELDGV